jgi:acyl-CoA reductase-like NAD-dependent aldehyde dehydrogenase
MHALSLVNPYTETSFDEIAVSSPEELESIVDAAHTAYEDWRHTAIEERAALCTKFIDAFRAERESIARDVTLQMGKPIAQARGEVDTAIDRAQHTIAMAPEMLADDPVPETPGFKRYVRHEPVGVVLDIAAWNYPLLIAVNVVIPGVLAGNAVIIKHSSKTPLCGQAFVEAFARAGAPENLVQHVVAGHAETEALVRNPRVNYVSFTGSTKGGHEIVRSASDRFIDVGLELGGKDPAYVCGDADFDFAVANCVDGAFYNAGQSCCAIERIYVDEAIYENFVEAYAAKISEYVLGDPMEETTTLGPLASKAASEFLLGQIKDAVAAGGRLVVDPASFDVPEQGWFAAPAVIADAPQQCSLMQDESFGPVIGITKVRSDEETIRLMNDSPYGLTASIWTNDANRAARVGSEVETGTFFMNRCDYVDPALPWTGVKDTGRGCSLSRYGFLQLTRRKSMHLRVDV